MSDGCHIDLTDEFCESVRGFISRKMDIQLKATALTLCRVRIEVSYHTADHPHIRQTAMHEKPVDRLREGQVLIEKLDRLSAACDAIGIMSAAQAEAASRRLDRIGLQLSAIEEKYPQKEGTLEMILLAGDEADLREEADEIPFTDAAEFVRGLAEDRSKTVKKITVSWERYPDLFTAMEADRLSQSPPAP